MKSCRTKATVTDTRITTPTTPITSIVKPVAQVINDGVRLAQDKLQKSNIKLKSVKPAYTKLTPNREACPPFQVYKIEYPKEDRFPGCHHVGNKIPCRVGINRIQHTKLLATPNPVGL